MRGKLLGAAFGVALAGTVAGSALAAGCDSQGDKVAFHVRSLQTELMVAALTCGERAAYNDFAHRFQRTLITEGKALKRRFRHDHGARAEKKLNAYVTALANRASQRSIEARDSFCRDAGQIFAALNEMGPGDLGDFAMRQPAGDVDVPSTCRATLTLVEKTN